MSSVNVAVYTMSAYVVLDMVTRRPLRLGESGPRRFGLRAEAEQYMDALCYPAWREHYEVVMVERGTAGAHCDRRA